jgi:prolipoprotein diacylglyceryltransferase
MHSQWRCISILPFLFELTYGLKQAQIGISFKKENIINVIKEAFIAMVFGGKLKYTMAAKGSNNLEDIWVETFESLQSMLAILTIFLNIYFTFYITCKIVATKWD